MLVAIIVNETNMTMTITRTLAVLMLGFILSLGLGVYLANAQTGTGTTTLPTTPTTDPAMTTTPGFPNTGAGGDAMINIAALVSSGVILAGSAAYIARRMRQA